jgi:hypothetical protein
MATVQKFLSVTENSLDYDDTSEVSVSCTTPSSSIIQAFATTTIDPDLDKLSSPTDFKTFLPDSGASQYMTPHLADLFNVEEKLNIGVQVAGCHIIKCTTAGKIQIKISDDNGNTLFATCSRLHLCTWS